MTSITPPAAPWNIMRYGLGKAVRYVSVRFGTLRYGSIRFGSVRYGSVRFGSVKIRLELLNYFQMVLLVLNYLTES